MELYENFSKFCLVVTNGSCPLPQLECLQAQGTFAGTSYAQQGVSLSKESISPTTQKEEWESSGMEDKGEAERGVKRRNGRGKPLLLSRKVTD